MFTNIIPYGLPTSSIFATVHSSGLGLLFLCRFKPLFKTEAHPPRTLLCFTRISHWQGPCSRLVKRAGNITLNQPFEQTPSTLIVCDAAAGEHPRRRKITCEPTLAVRQGPWCTQRCRTGRWAKIKSGFNQLPSRCRDQLLIYNDDDDNLLMSIIIGFEFLPRFVLNFRKKPTISGTSWCYRLMRVCTKSSISLMHQFITPRNAFWHCVNPTATINVKLWKLFGKTTETTTGRRG